jgi:hypothetical protein
MLAHALVFGGLSGGRMAGHHPSAMDALAVLQDICSDHGAALPPGSDQKPDLDHPGCPCGPSCPLKTFGAIALTAIGPAWIRIENGAPVRITPNLEPPVVWTPPDVSARGPPILT